MLHADVRPIRWIHHAEQRHPSNHAVDHCSPAFLKSPPPPGTGKTTVARIIADVLYGLEVKTSNKLVEKSAHDLTADHAGQTTNEDSCMDGLGFKELLMDVQLSGSCAGLIELKTVGNRAGFGGGERRQMTSTSLTSAKTASGN